MRLADSIELQEVLAGVDEELNPTEITSWQFIGKCLITPNTAAQVTIGNDGKEYIYSYLVIMRKPKDYIPKENDIIHLIKGDGTIDKVCRIRGFVTLRNWLKIWV